MHKVIDTPWNAADVASTLKAKGVQTVIRYFNHTNSQKLPQKRIEPDEAAALAEAGLSLATVFQQRGGHGGHISDLDAESGRRDAARALKLAAGIGQPAGSGIYFAVDHDYSRPADLARIEPYFAAVAQALDGRYRVGVYGSGTVARTMLEAGHVDLIWLAAARRWSGTKDMLETDRWALYQIYPPVNDPLPHDGNVISAAWHDYGQFVPGGMPVFAAAPGTGMVAVTADFEGRWRAPNTVLMEVTARRGLKVRRGPGEQYDIETVLAHGTIVQVMGGDGAWLQVDLQGDGLADGFMHGDFLAPVSGGMPAPAGADNPYDVARAELALGVAEVPGSGNNPRIVMYHRTTRGGASPDSVPWCSSFVNYCVEQAGLIGTDSKRALTWADWGSDASGDPREGDIVVFERVGEGGHVGFLKQDLGTHIAVLGGNQSNRVRVQNYPRDGKLGSMTYRLRGIRRG